MNQGFWKKILIRKKQKKEPFFALAPMLDITDSPFRQILGESGGVDVFCTWFVSVDGLCSRGKDNILRHPNLGIISKERPLIVQLFGKDPEKFYRAAKIMAAAGFDGIDINMGCPDKDILKQGAGADLIKNPKLAREIIKAVKKGAGKIPVSVKTRIGYCAKSELEGWLAALVKEKPAAICLHGRTAKQKYGGEADWKAIAQAAKITKKNKIIIIGNGDIKNREEGLAKAKKSGVDGVMIGRAVLRDIFTFNKNKVEAGKEEKLRLLIKHSKLFGKYYGKNFGNFRKYLRSYASGFDGSKELRMKLMEAKNSGEIERIITDYSEV